MKNKLIILFAFILAFSAAPFAALAVNTADYYFLDSNFDDYVCTNGYSPLPPGITTYGAESFSSRGKVYSEVIEPGNTAVRITNGTDATQDNSSIRFLYNWGTASPLVYGRSYDGRIRLQVRVKVDNKTVLREFDLRPSVSPGAQPAKFGFDADGNIVAYDNGAKQILRQYEINTWYTIDIEYYSEGGVYKYSASVKTDGGEFEALFNGYTAKTGNTVLADIGRMQVWQSSNAGKSPGTMWVD
jgi:hypothetical protein